MPPSFWCGPYQRLLSRIARARLWSLRTDVDAVGLKDILIETVAVEWPLDAAGIHADTVLHQRVADCRTCGGDEKLDAGRIVGDRVLSNQIARRKDVDPNARESAVRNNVLFDGVVDAGEDQDAYSITPERVFLDDVVRDAASQHDCPDRAVQERVLLDRVADAAGLKVDPFPVPAEFVVFDDDVARIHHAHCGLKVLDDASDNRHVSSSDDADAQATRRRAGPRDRVTIQADSDSVGAHDKAVAGAAQVVIES